MLCGQQCFHPVAVLHFFLQVCRHPLVLSLDCLYTKKCILWLRSFQTLIDPSLLKVQNRSSQMVPSGPPSILQPGPSPCSSSAIPPALHWAALWLCCLPPCYPNTPFLSWGPGLGGVYVYLRQESWWKSPVMTNCCKLGLVVSNSVVEEVPKRTSKNKCLKD